MSECMIYGANGYTGRLVVREALARGLRPSLAGRNREELSALAAEAGLACRVFALDDPAALRAGLNGTRVVLHCAGPFSATAAPMLEACLAAGVHYLDITGEIDVFAFCHAQHARAQAAGIVVLPGAGFDVVPTDCLAAQLARALPDATELVLAFEAGGGPSPGTAKTGIEGLASGGRVRRDGVLQRVPLAWKTRHFDGPDGPRLAVTIPWGDVYTAFVSTGIPNVEVYLSVPPSAVRRLRRLRRLGPLLGLRFVQAWLKRRIERRVPGPSERRREGSGCLVWGEVRNAAGACVARQLRTPNGYDLTAASSVRILAELLSTPHAPGYYTPSQLMGADFVNSLPGVSAG